MTRTGSTEKPGVDAAIRVGAAIPVGAVIPAAGRSRRMGRSKPLLPLGDTDFLGTLLRRLRDPEVAAAPIAVVYRRDDAALAARLALEPVRPVAVAPGAGDMLHSVRVGAAALCGGKRGAEPSPSAPVGLLVWPADAPAVTLDTVRRVAQIARASPEAIVQPMHEGEPGHPLYVPAPLLLREQGEVQNEGRDEARDEGLGEAPSGEGGLRAVIQRAIQTGGRRLRAVEVDDPGCRLNVNTPAQYRTLRKG